MPRHIRMPNGTVIRNVPDDITKEQFRQKFIANFGEEKWQQLLTPADPTQSYGPVVDAGDDDSSLDLAPPAATPPERAVGAAQIADVNRAATATRELETADSPFVKGSVPNLQLEQRRVLGDDDIPAFAQVFRRPVEAAGRQVRELVESGEATPEELGISQEQFDQVVMDRLNRAVRERQQHTGEPTTVTAEEPQDDSQRGWLEYLKRVTTQTPKQIGAGLRLLGAKAGREGRADTVLGEAFLYGLAEQAEKGEISEEAGRLVTEAAARAGLTPDQYAGLVAQQLNEATKAEFRAARDYLDAAEFIEAAKPRSATEGGWIPHIAAMIIENAPHQVAYILAGAATANPGVTMSLFSTDVFARTYAKARMDGRSGAEATQDAFASTIIEAATEAVPVAKFIKLLRAGNKSKAVKLLEGLGTEAAQEVLAEAAQIGYDIGILDEDMGWGEIFARLRDAGVVGAVIGGAVAAPVAVIGDDAMADANRAIADAKQQIQSVVLRMQNPNERVSRQEIEQARQAYQSAIEAKRKLIEEREEAKKAKKEAREKKREAKAQKKDEKARKKATPVERARIDARKRQAEADQSVKGELTQTDTRVAETLEKIAEGQITEEDADAVKEVLDLGYARVTSAGKVVVLPAGRRRVKAVREALEKKDQQPQGLEDTVVEPVPYKSPERRAQQQAIDEEIGRLIRGDKEIKPRQFKSAMRRRQELVDRIDKSIKDPKTVAKLADAIVKSDEMAKAFEQRERELAAEADRKRDRDYDLALKQQKELENDIALNLARLDEAAVSGYQGTRLGDVLREAYKRLEEEERKAKERLRESFWVKPVQGTLFDISGAFVKGSEVWANAVAVGALKVAKHGAKYAAWSADMVGEFGESIKPALAKIYHAAKQRAKNILKLTHEKFQSGERKGELKYAPKQYAKPGQIRTLRRLLTQFAKEGEAGRFWYERSGKALLQVTGGDKSKARKLAGLLAIYSSGTPVSANLTNALKMWSQFQANPDMKLPRHGTVAGRFSEQDRTALEWLRSSETDEHFAEKIGNKRFPFFKNLMREIDPENYDAGQGVTVDLWMMRAFGYTTDAPTDAQYAFAAAEIERIANKLGWEKQQAQAAIWVAIKSRWEHVRNRVRERAINEGIAREVEGNLEVLDQNRFSEIARQEALKTSVVDLEKRLRESKADFMDYMSSHLGTLSWEAQPSTAVAPELASMPLEAKLAMQREMAEVLTNPETGQPYLAEWLGLLSHGEFVGPGAWMGEVGAASQVGVILPPKHKKGSKEAEVERGAKAAMDGYSAILGKLLKQDGVAWHRPFMTRSMRDANMVHIDTAQPLSPEQTQIFYNAIIEEGIFQGLTHEEATEYAPIVIEGGVRVLNFSPERFLDKKGTPDQKLFRDMIVRAADRAGIAGAITMARTDSNLVTNDWVQYPNGEQYDEAINQIGDRRVAEAARRAESQLAPAVAKVLQKYRKQYGRAQEEAEEGGRRQAVAFHQRNAPPPAEGMVRFRHYGRIWEGTLDPKFAGTGLRDAAFRGGSQEAISLYPFELVRGTPEPGVGPVPLFVDVPADRLYDASADPEGFRPKAREPIAVDIEGKPIEGGPTRFDLRKFQNLLKEAGYIGFHLPEGDGILRGQARIWEPVTIQVHEGAFQRDTEGREFHRAFHGSPHTFDSFSLDAIGTGEGAQAYGWGLYFAENKGIAESYARALSGPTAPLKDVLVRGESVGVQTPEGHAAKLIGESGGSKHEIVRLAKQWLEEAEAGENPAFEDFGRELGITGAEYAQRLLETAESITKKDVKLIRSDGVNYEVEIDDEAVARMLDWDKPIASQPEIADLIAKLTLSKDTVDYWKGVLSADLAENGPTFYPEERLMRVIDEVVKYGQYGPDFGFTAYDELREAAPETAEDFIDVVERQGLGGIDPVVDTGETLYRMLAEAFGSEEKASKKLLAAGIPGIKYLDAESRASGEGTRNLVLFDTSFITEVKRDGKTVSKKDLDAELSALPKGRSTVTDGVPKAEIEAAIEKHFKPLYGITNFKVTESFDEFPPGDREVAERVGNVLGMHSMDPIDGPTIYIHAPNHQNADQVVETILHETVGHFGLQALLGPKQYEKTMNAVLRSFHNEIARVRGISEVSLAMEKESARHLHAEEFLAEMATKILKGQDLAKSKLSLWQRIVSEINLALARMGLKNLSERDVARLILRAHQFIRRHGEADLKKRVAQVQRVKEARRIMERAGVAQSEFSLKKARDADPELDRFLEKIGHGRNSRLKPFRDWWFERRGRIKQIFEIEVLDQFAGIKHLGAELDMKDAAMDAYMSVRLTAGADTVIRSALEYGVPAFDKEGMPHIVPGTRGLIEILAPVGQSAEMLKMFEAFIVARRAKNLSKEGRENLLKRSEIAAVLRYVRKNKLWKLFNETAREMQQWKKGVLDFASAAGLIDETTRPLWERNDHVPFYRVLSDKRVVGPFAHASLRLGHIGKVIHRLRGGTDALKNPLESIVQNSGMLIEAAIKNRAMLDLVRHFMGTGVITKAPQAEITSALIPMQQVRDLLDENGVSLDAVGQDLLQGIRKLMALRPPEGDNVFSVQVNGKKQYYYAHDPGLMRALGGINPNQWIWLMKILRMPKRVLTRAVTLTPDFILRNWFRDMMHSFVIARHGNIVPIYDSMKGWAKAVREDGTFRDILSGGGMFDSGYVNASDPRKQNIAIRRGILKEGRGNILDNARKLADFYMRLANGAENAHRVVVYQKTLRETGSRKRALFEARDLMDFSVRGANPIVRFLTETVPFWGARVQGTARTGKSIIYESPAVSAMRAIPIVLASVALYAMNRDDERYKALSGFEKRMYYYFFDVFEQGDVWRLPKPFEVGALFGAIPEVLTEYILSNEPDRGKQLGDSIAWIIKEMFALSPDVQLLHPLYELDKNWNTFTQSPIITYWESQLAPEDRWTHTTSRAVRALAHSMPDWAPEWSRSPKQLQHLLTGYFGSMMDYAMVAADMLYRKMNPDEPPAPAMRLDETPFIKAFRREETRKYDAYIEELYQVLAEAEKIHNSIRRNIKMGTKESRERAKKLREEHQELLYARARMKGAGEQLSKINKQIQRVYQHKTMTPEQKKERIDKLLERRSKIAERVFPYRPGGPKNRFSEGPVDSHWEKLLETIQGKPKKEQVDALIGANLPHMAILVNDVNVSMEKLQRAAA